MSSLASAIPRLTNRNSGFHGRPGYAAKLGLGTARHAAVLPGRGGSQNSCHMNCCGFILGAQVALHSISVFPPSKYHLASPLSFNSPATASRKSNTLSSPDSLTFSAVCSSVFLDKLQRDYWAIKHSRCVLKKQMIHFFSYYIDLAAYQRADNQILCVQCFFPPFLLQYMVRASVLSSSEGWR